MALIELYSEYWLASQDENYDYYDSTGSSWNTVTKAVEVYNQPNLPYQPGTGPSNYSKPTNELVDQFVYAGQLRKVYHNGEAGVTYVDSQPLVITPTIQTVLCFSGITGAISLEVTEGTGPYSYSWADGYTTQNRSLLSAGNYTVTVTDAAGLSKTETFAVTQPAAPIAIQLTKTDASCFGTPTGSITANVSGGTPGYSYSWNNGQTTAALVNVAAGNYTLTVTDSAGCIATASILLGQHSEIVVEAVIDENNVELNVSGGTGPYTFLWSDGSTLQNRTEIDSGSYQVTITDAVGCNKTVTVNIATFSFSFSKNPILLSLQATDLQSKPNLSFLCEVWIEEVYLSDNFKKVFTFEQPADLSGKTTFNVRPILDSYLKPFLPEGKETSISLADSVFKRYYLRYTEKFGLIPAPGTYTQADIKYVILGGLSFEELSTGNFFTSFLPSVKPFFSWEPVEKEVYADQPEYLFYMHNSFNENIGFRVFYKVYYEDGTTSESYLKEYTFPVNRWEVFCIPAGADQLGLQAIKPVTAWEVYVTDRADHSIILSEKRYYTIRAEYAEKKRYFLYLNSLGGINTLCCIGQASKELEIEEQQIEKILPYSYKLSEGETATVQKLAKPSLKLNTGYLTEAQGEALSDFLISEKVIYLDRERSSDQGRYIAGPIEVRRFKTVDEAETIKVLEFDFILPKMYRYTPRL